MKTLIIISLSVLVLVSLNNVLTIEAALPPQDPASRQEPTKTPITLDDVLAGRFGIAGFGGSWIPGSDSEIRIVSGGTVTEYDASTNSSKILVEGSVFTAHLGEGQLAGLTFSADRKFILVEHGRTSLWRHSSLAKYDIYDPISGTFLKLIPTGLPEDPQPQLQLVQWSPTNNALAFVYENNIYYRNTADNTGTVVQITLDGASEIIFNGISDWVYEEEMFGSPVALWFSTNSSSLAFVRFDDTLVEYYQWPLYGEPGVNETVYPKYEPIRYPKSGRTNPKVSMNLVALTGDEAFKVKPIEYPADEDESLQHYIATAKWTTSTDLIVINLNRAQNHATWHRCKVSDATCETVYSYEQANGWVDAHTPSVLSDGSTSTLFTLQPVLQGDGKSYNQIVSIPVVTGSTATPVTSGLISVDSILGVDSTNKKIYFAATGWYPETNRTDPSENHVYAVDSTNPGSNAVLQCITCTQKNNAGEDCMSNSVSFSADFTYYTHSCRGPAIPMVATKKTADNAIVNVWTDNSPLRETLATKLVPTSQSLEVPVADGFIAKVRLYLPPNFDAAKKYPLLIDVYGGPDSQKITQGLSVDWGTSLVSNKEVIYGSIDGRGSGRQSAEQRFTVYKNLGTAEIEDQIAVTKYLVDNLAFIDANRTAIWGWSYGGYATAMVMGKDVDNVFKCGISVAPVTSWLYYDTIYTERYMLLPTLEDNWSNYNASSVMNHIDNFKNKQFLLIHGNADDNVHYSNSMMLARALEKADVMFDQLSYPEENHSIGGAGMRRHLYHSIERFLFRDCFAVDEGVEQRGNGSTMLLANSFNMFAMALTVIVTYFKRF